MNRKHILHVKNSLSYAGDTIIEYRFAQLLKDEFIFDWFLISDEIGVFESRFKDLGSSVVHSSQLKKNYNTKTHPSTFYEYLKNNHYDIVYIDTCFSGRSIWLLLAKWAGVPRRILHSHNSAIEGGINPLIHWIFKQIMYFSVTDYVACSPEAAKWLFPKSKARNAVVINNGLDLNEFKFNLNKRNSIRNSLNINDSTYIMGHVGRFDKVKNHLKLIKIFFELLSIHPDSMLFLIGDGEQKENIKKQILNLDITSNIIFIGTTDKIPDYLSAMDSFVLPSYFEGLPLTAIEAECSGLSVYISDGVPKSAIITDRTHQIELRKSDKEWAEIISSDIGKKYNRLDAVDQIRAGGYDILDCVQKLRNILNSKNRYGI